MHPKILRPAIFVKVFHFPPLLSDLDKFIEMRKDEEEAATG
jgi:hypothetical protein